MTTEQLLTAIQGVPFGSARLRVLASLTRIPQKRIARKLRLSQPTVSLIFTGQRDASPTERTTIANAFGLSSDQIFGASEPQAVNS